MNQVLIIGILSTICIAAMYFQAWIIAGAMCGLIFLVLVGKDEY
jgi:hypothetical protein